MHRESHEDLQRVFLELFEEYYYIPELRKRNTQMIKWNLLHRAEKMYFLQPKWKTS